MGLSLMRGFGKTSDTKPSFKKHDDVSRTVVRRKKGGSTAASLSVDAAKEKLIESGVYVHPTAIVESRSIGARTRIWAFAHVLAGATIGSDCNIGNHAFVEGGATLGNNVTLKNNVCVWEGVVIEDDVFVGPGVSFTNDRYPRSPRMVEAGGRYSNKANWLLRTIVERGCSIGANTTLTPGVTLGRYSLIAAGAVVTQDVPRHALMVGSPARRRGYVCRCGQKLNRSGSMYCCPVCGFLLSARMLAIGNE